MENTRLTTVHCWLLSTLPAKPRELSKKPLGKSRPAQISGGLPNAALHSSPFEGGPEGPCVSQPRLSAEETPRVLHRQAWEAFYLHKTK